MAERALRGTSIGSKSLESEEGVTFADRKEAVYRTESGDTFKVVFAAEAAVPQEWESKSGELGQLIGEADSAGDEKPTKPQRTHWDMLMERRTTEQLEQLLEDQLQTLRDGRLREGPHYQMR